MSYKDQPFQQRWNGVWAREAQAAYERDRIGRAIPYQRWGLDRPPFSSAALMAAPSHIRYAPDFLEEVDRHLRLVEVKGCGRDQVIKLKLEQLDALGHVDVYDAPVWFCLWNNVTRTLIDVELGAVKDLETGAQVEGRVGVFDADTRPKPYVSLRWRNLAFRGHEHEVGG